MNETRVWRFVPADLRLAHGDGRKIIEGETLSVEGEIVPCRGGFARGLHGSALLTDALLHIGYCYTQCRLTRSTLHGTVVEHPDGAKLAASHCTHERVLTSDETSDFLWRWALWCAGRALRYCDPFTRVQLRAVLRGRPLLRCTQRARDAASYASDAADAASYASVAASYASVASVAASYAADAASYAADAASYAADAASYAAERDRQEAYALRLFDNMFCKKGTR